MRYVFGIDGGGTKTECVLFDEQGKLVATGRSGPSNPVRVGFERAVSALRESADAALRQAGIPQNRVVALCAGLAGAGDPASAQQIRDEARNAFPGMQRKICTDLDIALEATGYGPAILLIAGTGSAAMGRAADGRVERAGGQGWRAGDEGSASDVGKKAVSSAKHHRESSGEESSLGVRLLDELAISNWSELRPEKVVADRRLAPRDSTIEDTLDIYPRLFPIVAKAADASDPVARALLKEAAEHLTDLVAHLITKLDLEIVPFRLAKSGGMIGRCAFFDAELDRLLARAAPHGAIGELVVTPAKAAAQMAWRLVHGDS
ncbi:MAG TPA: BadF/BadG/BcrA/BcrD ATPase family protein [Candidatus Acidoferrum sp.]|jgi:N-acetylglucosamine kinase-like BadF-type ATPase